MFAPARLATLLAALLVAGCANDCEEARDKLDSCRDEIHHTNGLATHPLPLTIEDDCSGPNRCVSQCVNDTSCAGLAFVLNGNRVTDPNTKVPGDAAEFSDCFERCTGVAL